MWKENKGDLGDNRIIINMNKRAIQEKSASNSEDEGSGRIGREKNIWCNECEIIRNKIKVIVKYKHK